MDYKNNNKYISDKPLKEYELKKLFDDYIPMTPSDNRILMAEEYNWKIEHGFSQRDYTQFARKK